MVLLFLPAASSQESSRHSRFPHRLCKNFYVFFPAKPARAIQFETIAARCTICNHGLSKMSQVREVQWKKTTREQRNGVVSVSSFIPIQNTETMRLHIIQKQRPLEAMLLLFVRWCSKFEWAGVVYSTNWFTVPSGVEMSLEPISKRFIGCRCWSPVGTISQVWWIFALTCSWSRYWETYRDKPLLGERTCLKIPAESGHSYLPLIVEPIRIDLHNGFANPCRRRFTVRWLL